MNQIASYASRSYEDPAKLIEDLLKQLNTIGVLLPDGSGRRIHLGLGGKKGIELATQTRENPHI